MKNNYALSDKTWDKIISKFESYKEEHGEVTFYKYINNVYDENRQNRFRLRRNEFNE